MLKLLRKNTNELKEKQIKIEETITKIFNMLDIDKCVTRIETIIEQTLKKQNLQESTIREERTEYK